MRWAWERISTGVTPVELPARVEAIRAFSMGWARRQLVSISLCGKGGCGRILMHSGTSDSRSVHNEGGSEHSGKRGVR